MPRRLAVGLLLAVCAANANAAPIPGASSSMLVSVEVVRPATVRSEFDARGAPAARVAHAEARISTTSLTSVRTDGTSTRSPSDDRGRPVVDVEY
ncbi:MAG TPA: hypothetical protein VK391_02880 [Allosphingosinicella sp.]|nr:hypothetical protein [Allosphingosinicella sp.]